MLRGTMNTINTYRKKSYLTELPIIAKLSSAGFEGSLLTFSEFLKKYLATFFRGRGKNA
jgi:hypothetical protein